jgi:DNA-binding IclR family transcriptional regulator
VTSKVVSILLTFADSDVQSLTEIARLAGLPVSTAHRLVAELAAGGVVERTDDAHYRAASPLKVIGSQAVQPAGLHERTRRVMEDVCAATRTDVRLGVLDGFSIAYTEKFVGHSPVSAFSANESLPAHATAMGKALLAFSPPQLVDTLIERGLERYTKYTLVTGERLRQALDITRLTRIALCRWELELGAAAIAAPIFDECGRVLAAIELRVRDLRQDLHTMRPALTVAAGCLSRELAAGRPFGFLGPVPVPVPEPSGARLPAPVPVGGRVHS